MQVVFWADFNHDDPPQTLVITDAFPKGITPQVGALLRFKIPPQMMVKEQGAIVSPIVGEKGKDWSRRIVLVDQFGRKYKTKKMTFKWAGL